MKIPRWVWWLLGIVAAIVSAPFLAMFCWGLSQALDERSRSFEEKVQLEGAAVWSSGTKAESADEGRCTLIYTLQFARTGQPRENVEEIESSGCNPSHTLSHAAWFAFGNGTYLHVDNGLYWRDPQGCWNNKPPFYDGKNDWWLIRVKTREGQLVYRSAAKGRTFYRVFQLPQKVGDPWILKNRPLPR